MRRTRKAGGARDAERPEIGPVGPELCCPACLDRGRPLRLVVDGRYRLVRCGTCGTEYFRPDPRLGGAAGAGAVSEYWERYKFHLYANTMVQHDYEQRYASALRQAERLAGPIGSVLDVGCGIGNFLAFAQARSITAYGVDVDADAVAEARSRGLTAAESHEVDTLVGDGGVAAVTLWDVIEHMYEPEPVIRGVLAKLRPGGALIMETPDAAFPVRRLVLAVHALSRGRIDLTGHLYYWEHKIYFTEAGLSAILARLGYAICRVEHETSPRHKMQETFAHYARDSLVDRLLAATWPLLESGTRRLGRGNKLILVARSAGSAGGTA